METRTIRAFAFFQVLLLISVGVPAQQTTGEQFMRQLQIKLDGLVLELELAASLIPIEELGLDSALAQQLTRLGITSVQELEAGGGFQRPVDLAAAQACLEAVFAANGVNADAGRLIQQARQFMADPNRAAVGRTRADQFVGLRRQKFEERLSKEAVPEIFAMSLAMRDAKRAFVSMAQSARMDVLVGGDDSNSGSTSLVSKGSVPSVLGFAVENGALTREVSGTTLTFRGNPVGIFKAFGDLGHFESYQADDAATRWLRKFSFALSFDTDRGPQPGTFTGGEQQLSALSFRYEVINKRDPRNQLYAERWDNLIEGDFKLLTRRLALVVKGLDTEPAFMDWLEETRNETFQAAAGGADAIRAKLQSRFEELDTLEIPDGLSREVSAFVNAFNAYRDERKSILEDASKGPLVTFEYTNLREPASADLSNLKLIAEGAFFKGKVDLTANASVTFFNSTPLGGGDRLRDFQLSVQADRALGKIPRLGSIVFSVAGKYERLVDDVVMPGAVMPAGMMPAGMMPVAPAGDIAIGQLKLTIPIQGTGMRIVPLSVSFANRTELIDESEVRGNFGITFDLDSILARLTP